MKVFIVCPNRAYQNMFTEAGWEITPVMENADLIQFTGGADVSPYLYGRPTHTKTTSSVIRDQMEARVFKKAIYLQIPMAGICRGGQFLSVMCGGELFQDVDNHLGPHDLIDEESSESVLVTSTHHQMMRDNPSAELVAWADKLSTRKEYFGEDNKLIVQEDTTIDIEALYYPKEKALCFQPHPEFPNADRCRNYYFQLLERYLL